MVAAGAAALMAASEGGSSKGADNPQSRYEAQHGQPSCDAAEKRSVKLEKKNSLRSPTGNKSAACIRETKASRLRAASIVSPTDATPSTRKSPMGEAPCSWSLQTATSLSRKPKSPMSSGSRIPTCTSREKDKTVKRNSVAMKSPETEDKRTQHMTYHEKTSERVRTRRQIAKQSSSSSSSASSASSRHETNATGRCKFDVQQRNTSFATSSTSASIASSSGMRTRSSTQRSSSDLPDDENSEVLRRVDALTALTRATMERVERLTINSTPSISSRSRIPTSELHQRPTSTQTTTTLTRRPSKKLAPSSSPSSTPTDPRRPIADPEDPSKTNTQTQKPSQPPISILKHKTTMDLHGSSSPSTPGSSSATTTTTETTTTSSSSSTNLQTTFMVEKFTAKHGILKKRSSLDENEILRRRRSCSPDVAPAERPEPTDFKPILKSDRRSSLDELVKRSQSPDANSQVPHHHQHHQQQPTSILKRKSLMEDDREDGQHGNSEPTSILKRSSSTGHKSVPTTLNHVSIGLAIAKTLGCPMDNPNSASEVRPILKKKFSREESSSSDPPSLEPRPILKKKSSTDSDEHDDRPMKTILKSSRKSSNDDSANFFNDDGSPKKLSMLKNRSIQRRTNSLPECDVVRPILKQCGGASRECSVTRLGFAGNEEGMIDDGGLEMTKSRFLRKRARSVGQMQWDGDERERWGSREGSGSGVEERGGAKRVEGLDGEACFGGFDEFAGASSSAIAPIVSFKLPSREEMEDRYDDRRPVSNNESFNDDDDLNNVPKFRHNYEHCQPNDSYNEIDDETEYPHNHNDDEDDEEEEENYNDRYDRNIDLPSSSVNRSLVNKNDEKISPKYDDSSQSNSQKSHFTPTTPKNSQTPKIQRSTITESKTSPKKIITSREKVFEIAQRFKNLETAKKSVDDDFTEKFRANSQKIGRETSEQHKTDRFNTQPVTYDELREALLHNQRETVKKNFSSTTEIREDEKSSRIGKSVVEPSKLSLAERVSMFNRRIATETVENNFSTTNERSQRRQRSANRYKTQPITMEEVEVATQCRSTKNSNNDDNNEFSSTTNDETKVEHENTSIGNNFVAPRSILKLSTHAQTSNEFFYESTTSLDVTDGNFHAATNSSKILRSEKREKNVKTWESDEKKNKIEHFFDDDDRVSHVTRGGDSRECDSVGSASSNVTKVDSSSDNDAICIDVADHVAKSTTGDKFAAEKGAKIRCGRINGKSRCNDADDERKIGGDEILREVREIDFPKMSIAERLAALQRRGTNDWKRRVNNDTHTVTSGIAKFTVNGIPRIVTTQSEKDELTIKQQKLAERLEKLESAAEGWRKRVAVPDAVKFSVAGKMKVEQLEIVGTGPLSPLIEVAANSNVDGKKKVPRPERFRSQKNPRELTTTSTSPIDGLKIHVRSPDPASGGSDDESRTTNRTASILSVPRADDETFTSFFSNVSFAKCEAETLSLAESDFDVVTSFSERLGTRRTVQTQRRRLPSKNPLRTLAARTDLKDEYTEMTTGVAERVMRSLNIEKLAQKSSLAIEALAGLASTEDFGAVTLKNVCQDSTVYGNRLPPHKDLMLILVKGRRHVQVRLVEPVAASINSGDNYILVTKNELYNYVGKYSNVIERVRGAEIALSIQQNRDLGCRAGQVITVSEEKPSCTVEQVTNFWKILGADADTVEVIDGGHPDEDELYESALTDTNMIYEVIGDDELSPMENYWGAMPRIQMLDPSKILIFDFGSEMYIWNGKIATSEKRKFATHLAEELWLEGYDYTECTVSPISSASIIGRRTKIRETEKKSTTRPSWCLIAKLTQHMETVLFREKFLDWPNVTGIIRVRNNNEEKEQGDGKIVVEPPNVDDMIDAKSPEVDFVLEGCHLGRGTGWYDDELMRQSVVATTNVTVWHIDEFSYTMLSGSSVGQFYTGDSYIVRWTYTVTMTGRGLSGEPSKHASKGRDRCAYFIWQGQRASLNEQGTAALLTVELDQEQGPQIRVVEGFEPPIFLNLFAGRMIVHAGKKSNTSVTKKWRLYVCRGNVDAESSLTEVPCSTRQLRSRGSLLLIDTKNGKIYVWHGRAAHPRLKQIALRIAKFLKNYRPRETGLGDHIDVNVREINEIDEEPAAFYEALGGMNKQLYVPLQGNRIPNHTPRLFHLSSVSGEFASTELLCPHRSDVVTPFPFLQNELYQVNQPALFLLDNKDELWLWQGWWPDTGSDDQTGSGAVRWQAERRAAMVMAVRYWKKLHPDNNDCPVYLVWAGLEPLAFTNLFPTWTYHDEIAELNIRDGRDSGEVLTVEGELARLTQSTYPPAQLLQRPLPEGVDPTILEQYLSPQHFEELLGMNVNEFDELPAWKQINIKKKIGLF